MAVGRKCGFGVFLLVVLVAASASAKAPETKAAETKAVPPKTPTPQAPPPKAQPTKAPPVKAPEAKVQPAKAPEVKTAVVKSPIGSKKILVLLPVGAPSHHNVFSALTNELLERGHYVTIVSCLPQKKKHPRLREVLLKDPFEEFMKRIGTDFMTKPQPAWQKVVMMYFIGKLLNKSVLDDPKALALKEENFDLVVVETYFFQEPLLAFAHHFGCPALTLNPFGYSSQLNEFTGGQINPAFVPNIFGGGTRPETFVDRLSNTVITAFSWLSYHLYWYPVANSMMHEAFPDAPPLYDLMTNVSLTLINNHAALMVPVALSPSVIEVGGIHIKPGKPLPADLKKWIEESENGIVYFSLGSNIKTEILPQERVDSLFASLGKLKERVLVKWNTEPPKNAPANCRFEKWVPQQEVLVHPKLKVFVTHGGLLSIQESVYFGAALVGMPVFGDQAMNMQTAVQQGFGQMVNFFDFTTEELDAALKEVINNSKYRAQSKKMSERFRSDPIQPLDKAIYYTELLIELGDLKHLQPGSVHLHWYQNLLLDVIAVLAIGAYLSWKILRCICSTCLGCCRKSPKSKKD